MNRRGFLLGGLATFAAPAIVKAEILMPVRRIIIPRAWLPCDGKPIDRREYPALYQLMESSGFGARAPQLPSHWMKTDFDRSPTTCLNNTIFGAIPVGSIWMMIGEP